MVRFSRENGKSNEEFRNIIKAFPNTTGALYPAAIDH